MVVPIYGNAKSGYSGKAKGVIQREERDDGIWLGLMSVN
jgi:hypothetical protein